MKMALTAFAVAALLSGAGVMVARAADVPPGAAACSGCHPASRAVDSPVPRLNGVATTDIVAAMQEFRSGQRPATVMDRIAKGFSDDEVRAIAAWWSTQRD